MKRILLGIFAITLASCGGRDVDPTPSPNGSVGDARVLHAETLRALALKPGTVWSWSQRAELEYGRFDAEQEAIERHYVWTITYEERVLAVRADGARAIVELERTVGAIEGEPPPEDDDLGMTPRNDRFVWVVAPDVPLHQGLEPKDYAIVHRVTGVIEQDDYDPLALEDAPMLFTHPFRVHGLWQEDGEGRALGLRERVITGTRTIVEALDRVHVPAGTFSHCHRIVRQWTIDEDDEWVCDGVGPVRRRVSGTHASYRALRESTLTTFTKKNPLIESLASNATDPS